ncbi:uncharacterized protein LOC117645156 [Thrips palmi]|uniref:Uncharacterized protein LOC117645156 n=1 Tax=Thrips palmi TaxID=161013 RepID=A0A6P8ZMQ7_THRPL|nr:uncharacterized protein LOC117645156 [Thrips palmi]
MAAKSTVFALALAACLVMATALSACDSSAIDNLEKQIEICARNVPAERYADPKWLCARYVSRQFDKKRASCDISEAPEYLEYCLGGYASEEYVSFAVDCLKNAMSADICC